MYFSTKALSDSDKYTKYLKTETVLLRDVLQDVKLGTSCGKQSTKKVTNCEMNFCM